MTTIKIHNVETGEITEREMNTKELAQREIDKTAQAAEQAEATAKAVQRQALLTRLGITEEEARILLGGN